MKRATLIFATVLLYPIGCLAADSNKMYRDISPPGYETCSEFVEVSDECKEGYCTRFAVFRSWLQGYLTSYNLMAPDTYDIAAGKGRDATDKSLENWVANYCKQNPSKPFAEAVRELTIELYPTRHKKMPEE